jgi:hypothetical protein
VSWRTARSFHPPAGDPRRCRSTCISLLLRLRGAAPVQRAILRASRDRREHRADGRGMDTGPVCPASTPSATTRRRRAGNARDPGRALLVRRSTSGGGSSRSGRRTRGRHHAPKSSGGRTLDRRRPGRSPRVRAWPRTGRRHRACRRASRSPGPSRPVWPGASGARAGTADAAATGDGAADESSRVVAGWGRPGAGARLRRASLGERSRWPDRTHPPASARPETARRTPRVIRRRPRGGTQLRSPESFVRASRTGTGASPRSWPTGVADEAGVDLWIGPPRNAR